MAKPVGKPHQYVIKATGAVELSEPAGRLALVDRKLFNYLLAHAYEGLLSGKSEFTAVLGHIRAFSAEARSGTEDVDNRRIKDSIKRLQQTVVEFNSLDSDKGKTWESDPLLGGVKLVERTGELTYSFTNRIAEHLKVPALYSYISLKISYQFDTKYGLILYEVLKRYADRNAEVPWCKMTIDELRAILGCRDKLKDYKDLRQRALAPAIAEINDLAEFTVELDEIRQGGGRGGGKVKSLVFHIHRKEIEAARQAAKELDKPKVQRRGEKAVVTDEAATAAALRYLQDADITTRSKWAKEAEALGISMPEAPAAKPNLAHWVPAIARVICRSERLKP